MAALEKEGGRGASIGGPAGPGCVLAVAVDRELLKLRGRSPGSGNVQWCVGHRCLRADLSLLSCLQGYGMEFLRVRWRFSASYGAFYFSRLYWIVFKLSGGKENCMIWLNLLWHVGMVTVE